MSPAAGWFFSFKRSISSFSWRVSWHLLQTCLKEKLRLPQRWQAQSPALSWLSFLSCWVSSLRLISLSSGFSAAKAACCSSKAFASLSFLALFSLFYLFFAAFSASFSCSGLNMCSGLPVLSFTVLGFLHRWHSLRPLKL